MANTITISVSPQDIAFLQENPTLSPSKLFRSAVRLQRNREEFDDIYDIFDFCLKLREIQEKISFLQKEIQRRNERIESLQDVLAQKEIGERRVRATEQKNIGLACGTPEIESGITI